jgi:polyhydroxyalkanoate synthesis regulator phasin
MPDELEQAKKEDGKIERTIECAEELSRMIQNLNTALSRGDFEELKEILNMVKRRILELENYLNMLD